VPWIGNLVFVLQRDESIFDPTPFLFTCTALIAALAVFRFDLFEPAPTLRDARIDFIGDGVIVLDGRRRVADLNAAAQVVLRRRRAEAAGTTIDNLLPGWPAGTLPAGPLDVAVHDASGTRTFDVRCSPVQSLAGQSTGSVVTLRDVSERRAMELALRESEGRYRAVVDQAFDAVWLTNRDGAIVDVNPQACALLGHTRDELIGRRTSECAPAIDTAVNAPNGSALARGEALFWECELVTRTGPHLLVSGRTRQISPDLIVSTFRDITKERAHAEVRERLLSEAQTANRLKDEFLATLSHELRTPLNAVVGWTQVLARHPLDAAKMAHALEVIERNAVAQARLVDDLLDVSALTGGRARLVMRDSVVPAIVREAADSVRPLAAARGVTLHVRAPAELPPIPADSDRLRQAVWNLLTNAIKFTPSGGQVWLATRVTDGRLEITVTDTGSGIAPDFLPHVFEAFRQADSGSTRTSRGLGLGLTIVRRIVEAHGGQVEVESKGTGHGSTFRLWLPVHPLSSSERGKQVTSDQGPNGDSHIADCDSQTPD
jgi:PAS domain S-box-containing protein